MKRRITLVVDGEGVRNFTVLPQGSVASGYGCYSESVEDLPEPNRVQEFRVRVETAANTGPWTQAQLRDFMPKDVLKRSVFTVTEVDVTS